MAWYNIREIEEDGDKGIGSVEAEDIYEATKLFKGITERNKNKNYIIFKKDDSSDYLMVGSFDNDLMYYKYLTWSLMDLGEFDKETLIEIASQLKDFAISLE